MTRKKKLTVLSIFIIVWDAVFLTLTAVFFNVQRWATGSIYLFLCFATTFFTIVYMKESSSEMNSIDEELKVYKHDQALREGDINVEKES